MPSTKKTTDGSSKRKPVPHKLEHAQTVVNHINKQKMKKISLDTTTPSTTTPQITPMLPPNEGDKKVEESISDSSSDTGYSSDSESDAESKPTRKSIGLPPLKTSTSQTTPSPNAAKRKTPSHPTPEKKKQKTHDLQTIKNKISDVLKGKRIAVQGKFQLTREEFANMIQRNSGFYATHISKTNNVTWFITTDEAITGFKRANLDKAKQFKIPILREDYLYDCIDQGQVLPYDGYQLAPIHEESDNESSGYSSADSDSDHSRKKRRVSISEYEPQNNVARELLTTYKSLVIEDSIEKEKPIEETMFSDIVFQVKDKLFYCIRSLLALRSAHFKQIITNAMNDNKEQVLRITIDNVSPSVFKSILEYLVSGSMTITDTGDAVDICLYATSIDLSQAATDIVHKQVKKSIEQQDVIGTWRILDRLLTSPGAEKLRTESWFPLLTKYVCDHASILLSLPLSRAMMIEILSASELDVDELTLFKHVIKHGLVKQEQLMDTNADTNGKLFMQDDQDRIYYLDGKLYWYHGQELESIMETSLVRQQVADLLPLILYEHISLDDVMKNVEPIKLFNDLEVFEFCKAMHAVKSGLEYTILGCKQVHPRTKRVQIPKDDKLAKKTKKIAHTTPIKSASVNIQSPTSITPSQQRPAPFTPQAQFLVLNQNKMNQVVLPNTSPVSVLGIPLSGAASTSGQNSVKPTTTAPSPEPDRLPMVITQKYTVNAEELKRKSKVVLKTFNYRDTTWYLCLQPASPNLSVYLYNKDITDGKTLPNALPTKIYFNLHNQVDQEKKHTTSFVRTWQSVKAWGFASWIPLAEVFDEKNGWISHKNVDPEIQVSVTLEEQISQPVKK